MPSYKLVKIDPTHPTLGMLAHLVGVRIHDYAMTSMPEIDPMKVARSTMANLYAGDPTVLLLAAVDAETGKVGGHVLANFDPANQLVTVNQYRMDNDVGDMGLDALNRVHEWAKEFGVGPDRVTLVTTNIGDRWKQRGFRVVRYVWVKDES